MNLLNQPHSFPYITSYLAFRELPILLELLDEVRAAGRLAELLLVDGSGILHQRHAGIGRDSLEFFGPGIMWFAVHVEQG